MDRDFRCRPFRIVAACDARRRTPNTRRCGLVGRSVRRSFHGVMKSPTAALIWDIWQRHRTPFAWLGGIALVTAVVNLFVRLLGPSGLSQAAVQHDPGAGALALGMFNWHAMGGAFMLALVIFSYE